MAVIQFYNGKVLFVANSQPAFDKACCCHVTIPSCIQDPASPAYQPQLQLIAPNSIEIAFPPVSVHDPCQSGLSHGTVDQIIAGTLDMPGIYDPITGLRQAFGTQACFGYGFAGSDSTGALNPVLLNAPGQNCSLQVACDLIPTGGLILGSPALPPFHWRVYLVYTNTQNATAHVFLTWESGNVPQLPDGRYNLLGSFTCALDPSTVADFFHGDMRPLFNNFIGGGTSPDTDGFAPVSVTINAL